MTDTPIQQSSESTTAKRKRRWLQFNLRTLLVLMLVVGAGLGWVMNERRKNARLQADIDALESLCSYDVNYQPSMFDWLFNRSPRIVTRVYFPSNPNNDTNLVHLKGLSNLEVLLLDGTAITDNGLKHLRDFPNLAFLSLNDTAITDAGLQHIKSLTNLESLSLDGIKITDAGLEHLKGLTNLINLGVSNNKITDAGLVHLKALPNLENLYLTGTAITDAGMIHLKGLTNLKRLSLSGTPITDAGLEHFKGLALLSSLHLEKTSVTKDGVAELQRVLPNCRIYHEQPETFVGKRDNADKLPGPKLADLSKAVR